PDTVESEIEEEPASEIEAEPILEEEEEVTEETSEEEEVTEEIKEEKDEEAILEKTNEEEAIEEGEKDVYQKLPERLSETMADILLLDGMIAEEEGDLDGAAMSLRMVCLKAEEPYQRMMAYSQLKILYNNSGYYNKLLEISYELIQQNQIEEYEEGIRNQISFLESMLEDKDEV
ncbi:hypothetical protein, partial [Tindallia californiensis]